MPRTAKQLAASRANGWNSPSPVTAAGKACFSQNVLTDNGPYLRKEWSNLQPLSAVALSLDHFDGRLHRVQAHIERLRRALHRTIRLLQQLTAQNTQNEPEDVQPQSNEALSVLAPLRLGEKPTSPSPLVTTQSLHNPAYCCVCYPNQEEAKREQNTDHNP